MTQTTNSKGAKVSVIGLGSMGSALAQALLASGGQVTVWNRDQNKLKAFIEKGAAAAASAADAIAASPITVICVSDYATADKIIRTPEVTSILDGKTLIQLSTGTPKEARALDAWAQRHGASCLNGDILAWPRQIGTPEATITFSGHEALYKAHESTLRALGNTDFLGADPGFSAVLFAAVLSYLAGSWIGFVHGALISEQEGFSPEKFGS